MEWKSDVCLLLNIWTKLVDLRWNLFDCLTAYIWNFVVCLMVCVFIPPTRYGHFSGINRKVQLTYLRNGKPKASSEEEGIVLGHRLLCVLGHSDKLYVNKYTRMVIGSECQCNQSSVSNCVLEPRLQCFGCTSPRTTLFVSMATEKKSFDYLYKEKSNVKLSASCFRF